MKMNRSIAILVSLILDSEGFAAFWSVEGDTATLITDAPDETIASAVTLASIGA